jgi:hypothetical protein
MVVLVKPKIEMMIGSQAVQPLTSLVWGLEKNSKRFSAKLVPRMGR